MRTLDELLAHAVAKADAGDLDRERLRRVLREAVTALGYDVAPGGELADVRDLLKPRAPAWKPPEQRNVRHPAFRRR